jgi:DNA invertase Pin-like site-specific DNA recombinase
MDDVSKIIRDIKNCNATYKQIAIASGVSKPLIEKMMGKSHHRNLTIATIQKLQKGIKQISSAKKSQ